MANDNGLFDDPRVKKSYAKVRKALKESGLTYNDFFDD